MNKILKSNLFFLIVLFVITFVIYAKCINFGIINLDDYGSILGNIDFISNIKNIPQLFTTDCYYIGKEGSYYRPILTLTFSIETNIFGYNTKIYHLTNILLFLLSIYLTYLFFINLKQDINKNILKLILLLFLAHPLFISNVAYISTRGETLLLIFTNLFFINLIKYIENSKTSNLILTILFFSLSVFTKESGIVLIILCPLFIYCFNYNISNKKKYYLFLPNIILLSFYFIIRAHSVSSINFNELIKNSPQILLNIFNDFPIYITKLLIPYDIPLILFNPKPTLQEYIIFFCFIILLLFLTYKKIIERKIIFFGTSVFLLFLLPTFLILENQFFCHRLLLPSIGLLLIFCILLQKLTKNIKKGKIYFLFFYIILLVFFSYASFSNLYKYESSLSFFENAYKDAPNYHLICNGLAKEYINIENLKKAKEMSLNAINLNKNIDNCITYATILFLSKETDLSKQILYQLLELNNKQYTIYTKLYNIYLYERDLKNALDCSLKAVYYANSITNKTSAMENLAKIYAISGKYYDSLQILLELLKYNQKVDYYYNISLLYEDMNDYDNSVSYIRKALETDPKNKDFINQLKNIETKKLTENR